MYNCIVKLYTCCRCVCCDGADGASGTTHALRCNFCTEIDTVVCNGIAIVCCIIVFLLFLDGTTTVCDACDTTTVKQ